MTEALATPTQAIEPPAMRGGETAGGLIRKARLAAGMDVALLAAALKVPPKKIEALEENRWDLLPDAVFTRALASSVCRTLKTAPGPVLALMPDTQVKSLPSRDDGLNTPFRAPGDPSVLSNLSRALRFLVQPQTLVVLALAASALALLLVPSLTAKISAWLTPAGNTSASLASGDSAGNAAAAPEPVLYQEPAPPPGASPATVATAVAAPPVATVTQPSPAIPASAATGTPAPNAPGGQASAATASGNFLVMTASAPSWISITNARGVTVYRQMLTSGETAHVNNAQTPLTVVVGNAGGTQVLVRGQSMDLTPHTRENVARFEVK